MLSNKMTHPRLATAMFRPEFYPHRPEHIELTQTHISYIFIAGDYVYEVDGKALFRSLITFLNPSKPLKTG